MGERLVAVCDLCKRKQPDNHAGFFVNFLRRHRNCNFAGCRVMKDDNPFPTIERGYALEEPGVVSAQSYQEIIRG